MRRIMMSCARQAGLQQDIQALSPRWKPAPQSTARSMRACASDRGRAAHGAASFDRARTRAACQRPQSAVCMAGAAALACSGSVMETVTRPPVPRSTSVLGCLQRKCTLLECTQRAVKGLCGWVRVRMSLMSASRCRVDFDSVACLTLPLAQPISVSLALSDNTPGVAEWLVLQTAVTHVMCRCEAIQDILIDGPWS